MKVIIDRFEERYAIVELEDRTIVELSRQLIPHGAKEGDVIEILIDREETEKRRKKARDLMDRLVNEDVS